MRTRTRRPSAHIARVVSELLRTVPFCAPLALGTPAALAEPVSSATLTVDIPAQPLAQALSALASQTGLQMVYVSGLVRNERSQLVPAGIPVEEALKQLLQGTGLRFEYLTNRSVRILAAAPKTTQTAGENELSEVIVTANRREERLQDVPITVDVLTEATLARLNATTFDDFLGYLSGVTAHGVGPSQNNLYMRGLGVGDGPLQATGFSGPFPQVAIYLDEQSAQIPGRNLDLYTADLERIEVLEGPQGTLFGAGAEAGVLRYITHRPELDVTEATARTGVAMTAHGAPSYNASLILNLPLIPEKLAVRAVLYDERRGGYIDNIPGTFQHLSSDVSARFNGLTVSPDSVVINNAALVASDINPATYSGARFEALYKVSDDWDALIAESYQRMEADGVSTEAATDLLGKPQPDLTVQLFNSSYDKDWFENTALTVNGRLGPLKLLYAGSYLTRHIEQVQDYTDYARTGVFIDYYQCVLETPTSSTLRCFTPSQTWRNLETNTHQSHELRVSTPDAWRLRALGGLFFEKYTIHDQTDWYYLSALNTFNQVAPVTGYWTLNGSPYQPDGALVYSSTPGAKYFPGAPTLNDPNPRPLGDAFFNDLTRGYDQKAAYASVDYELIPHSLTLTAGTRYYSIRTFQVGAVGFSGACMHSNNPPNPCNIDGVNLNALGLSRTDSGFRSRANLSWKLTDDVLLYYTWSQGFRAGGYNRGFTPTYLSPLANGGLSNQTQADLHGGYVPPLGYTPDTLTNNELGWKTSWLGDRVRWNGAVYQEQWDHAQFAALDNTGISTFNGGDYRVRGMETSGTVQVLNGLALDFGVAWNHSELVREAQFFWADGTPINWSLLQTYSGEKISNPAGALGSPLAGAPAIRGNLRLRYETMLGNFAAFAQLGVVHQSNSLASTDRLSLNGQGNYVAYDLPGFSTIDGAVGFGKGAWQLQLYGQNLSDTRAQLFENSDQYYTAITVNRPRTVGLHFSYRFRSDQS